MKTSTSEKVSGKIIIDSPGFDADDQRNTILRLTDHIIDLSDLVLVFFDARHPEPGAMHDTLVHLVGDTIRRNDSEKFLYILNQIDTAAQEDNPEAVIAAWQRAIANKGLTAGRFYTIYNEEAAVPIEDPAVRARFESKRNADIAAIFERIHQVEVERSYRIIGALENIASDIEKNLVPRVKAAMKNWMRFVLIIDGLAFAVIAGLMIALSNWVNVWSVFAIDFTNHLVISGIKSAVVFGVLLMVHFSARKFAATMIARKLETADSAGNIRKAFLRNTRFFRSIFQLAPAGWSSRAKRVLAKVTADASSFIQTMNDRYTNPSGNARKKQATAEVISVVETDPVKVESAS